MNNIIIYWKTAFIKVTSGCKYSGTYPTHPGMCVPDKWTVMCVYVAFQLTVNEVVYLLRSVKSL